MPTAFPSFVTFQKKQFFNYAFAQLEKISFLIRNYPDKIKSPKNSKVTLVMVK